MATRKKPRPRLHRDDEVQVLRTVRCWHCNQPLRNRAVVMGRSKRKGHWLVRMQGGLQCTTVRRDDLHLVRRAKR